MSTQKPNKKKASTTAIVVIFITIIIASIAGTSDAAATGFNTIYGDSPIARQILSD